MGQKALEKAERLKKIKRMKVSGGRFPLWGSQVSPVPRFPGSPGFRVPPRGFPSRFPVSRFPLEVSLEVSSEVSPGVSGFRGEVSQGFP